MRSTWNFHSAGRIVFGPGAVREIATHLTKRRLRRVLLVTDQQLGRAGLVDRVAEPLRQSGLTVGVFEGGAAEPSIAVGEAAAAAAREFRPEAIVGLGGGSNMDVAKLTALIARHGGTHADYFGFDRVPGPVLPLVCVPTTSGTGSEVSHAAVLTDTANQVKVSTLSQFLRPDVAVVDPELTYSCPRQVTADSGIDALTHAIEACTAVDFDRLPVPPGEASAYEGRHPLGDCLAEQAIRLIGRHLTTAVREPGNRAAREGMSLAATLAGLAFSNCGVALVHALEYPLGGALHCSHGAGNGLLLPYVMRFNRPARQAVFAQIAGWLGEDVAGQSEAQAAERAIAAVERLRSDIGIPARIRDLGGRREQLPDFAAKAFAIKRLLQVNPRPYSEQDLVQLLEEAF